MEAISRYHNYSIFNLIKKEENLKNWISYKEKNI